MRRYAVLSAPLSLLLGFMLTALPSAPALAEREVAKSAAMPAPGTVGERFGVASSHIKLYDAPTVQAELDVLAAAGIGWLRCDFAWVDLEPVQGEWDFTATDRVVAEAEARGVKILGILGSSPLWANGGHDWNWPPSDIPAWEGYVSAVVSRYRGRVAAWEVWNEQNIHAFWQPEPDPVAYVTLLASASPRIRAADPAATVVMGGVAGLGSTDLDAYLTAGAAEYIDAVAYHPYAETIGVERQPEEDLLRPKEELCRYLVDFVHWLIAQHTERELEVWLTEVGWTTSSVSPPGVDEAAQAAYLLRTMVSYAATDVDRVIWFNLRDTWLNDLDRYGLLRLDFSPRPAYAFYSTFMRAFGPAEGPAPGAASFSCSAPGTLEAHAFRLPGGGLAISAWKSDDAPDTLSVSVPDPALADPVLVDPASGAESPAPGTSRDAAGNVTLSGLPIGMTPVILRLERRGSEPEPEPEPEPDVNAFYFAEGYTGDGFQEYLCVGNAGAEKAEVDIEFIFAAGSARDLHLSIPPGCRSTVDVNAVAGAGVEVAMVVTSPQDIVAERPMYFSYGPGWTGGHVVVGAGEPSDSIFFAEGYTGEGFEEWLCVLNPGEETAGLTFRFQTEEEGEKVLGGFSVGPRSRASFKVNDLLGGAYQASCVVESSRPVVVERPVYFDYEGRGDRHWRGGHCVMGASRLSGEFFFAEGTTREGFEEWLTLQNPHAYPIEVEAEYHFGQGQGESARKSYRVEGGRRLTLYVPDEVGKDRDVSVALSSSSTFLAERPMYFDYAGMGAAHWQGGHCVIGAASATPAMFFAEGYTGEGFHEWLCLQNPGAEDALLEVLYLTREEGALPARTLTVPARTRANIFVGEHAGMGYQLSCRLRVLSGPPLVAERPMYFSRGGRDGGHDAVAFDLP